MKNLKYLILRKLKESSVRLSWPCDLGNLHINTHVLSSSRFYSKRQSVDDCWASKPIKWEKAVVGVGSTSYSLWGPWEYSFIKPFGRNELRTMLQSWEYCCNNCRLRSQGRGEGKSWTNDLCCMRHLTIFGCSDIDILSSMIFLLTPEARTLS